MTHKDYLGAEVKVGDVIVYADGKYADLNTGMITKRNPIMLQVNGSGNVNPSQCMVVTDKYKVEFPEKYGALYATHKPKFQKDAKAPKAVIRYLLSIKTNKENDRVSLIVTVLTDGQPDKTIDQLGNFRDGRTRLARKTTGSWRTSLTDKLRFCDSYSSSPRTLELPAKIMKAFFGAIPDKTEILETFDDMRECKEYLQSNGVEV